MTWYGDSAYGTGELRGEIKDAGHRAVSKPKPVQSAVAGGFTLDDFTIDEGCGTLTCPADQTRPLSATRTMTFGALCRDCPLRAARADWAADPTLREDYRTYRPKTAHRACQR